MVSKKNFQNGRPMQRAGVGRGTAAPYNKPFRPQGLAGGVIGPGGNNFNQMMFNPSQIPDNPGYMDFNNPTPPIASSSVAGPAGANATQAQKKKNNKNKQKNKQPQQNGGAGGGNWNKNIQQRGGPNTRFSVGVGQRNFNPMQMGGPGPNRGGGGRRMMPGPMGGPRGGPMPPIPPHGFQPAMIPPMMPMGMGPRGQMPPPMGVQPPPFLRRSGRNGGRGGPMPPIPPPMVPPMIPPRMLPRGGMPPLPFNGAVGGKIKKPNPKQVKVVKSKSTIKTLKNLVNQYPLDKPWVTDDIRAEHAKKIDIEERLKGNKDDELFAQFKTQRDKFVAAYEAAREEYLKKEAAAVKATKDAKDKQTNNKTAAKDGNNKEAISKKNSKASA